VRPRRCVGGAAAGSRPARADAGAHRSRVRPARRATGGRRRAGRRGGLVSRDALTLVRRELRDQLRQRVDARGLAAAPPTERRLRVREEAMAVLRERGAILPARDLARVVNEVSDDVVGFGPIEFLLKDPSVTEVMVNGPDDVFVEREGRIERVPDRLFEGEEPVLHLIERIVGPLGLRVDQASPWVDARLPDGSRVHAIVPPLSLRGPVLTIRRFSQVAIEARDLLTTRSVGSRALRFLAACVRGRANIVISGGAGSGKTTLLGVLSGFIPDEERLITIEDAAELRLAKPHVVSLEARPANVEGRGEITVRHLVRNALRMRPERISFLRPYHFRPPGLSYPVIRLRGWVGRSGRRCRFVDMLAPCVIRPSVRSAVGPKALDAECFVLLFVLEVVLIAVSRGELTRLAGLRCVVRYELERAMESPGEPGRAVRKLGAVEDAAVGHADRSGSSRARVHVGVGFRDVRDVDGLRRRPRLGR